MKLRTYMFSAAAALVATALFSPTANAALVMTTFTLDAPSSTANQLGLILLDGSTTTNLSGTFTATLDIDQSTGVITSIELTGGNIVSSDWSMTVTGIGAVVGAGTLATTDTPAPPDPVTGTQFNAAAHQIILNAGTVTAGGNLVQNFASENLVIPGVGNGTITSTSAGAFFDIALTLPINSDQPIAGQNLNIAGSLVASAQIEAVPEPSSLAVAGLLAFGACLRRRRS